MTFREWLSTNECATYAILAFLFTACFVAGFLTR